MKEDITLLVIAPYYNVFIKELTEATSIYVRNINVFVHHNYLSELALYLPFSRFRWVEKFSKRNLVNLKGLPNNVKVHVISMFYFVPDGKNINLGEKLVRKFSEYIRKNKIEFDLIHGHTTWPQGYVAAKLGKEFGVPVVLTIHEDRDWFLKEYNSKNEKIYWTWRNADALIRVNKKDVPLLKEFNSNVYPIPNGFNPSKLPPLTQEVSRLRLGLPLNKKIIFSLGNLVERKGFHYLIEAMSKILKTRNDVLCFIGGDGPWKGKLQNQINSLSLQNHVKLLGFVPDEKLALWMNATDVFVLPSLNEGNPTVMFEALGVGLPFVGTAIGGVPEIIVSEDYGLLCPPADPECLAEKILIAIDKEWDREKIRKYSEQFTWDNIAKKILEEVYLPVLEGDRKWQV
ncbi:glycosyltransferase [Thermococcus aciditolerans]|uniref:Glycosyltransferase family 4 protein n=1 Tax=Thermococcus aciditolerans TaxID=2598455 RepID=A0A5C0SKC8_9EURY|nr:glycosyltransferase [Thermococcus aciditolerans]QEK14955.1 glycosyltransferase family 4 protein [Thermococcus aciditolerans]